MLREHVSFQRGNGFGSWISMEIGHLLEDFVAKIFERKTGFKIYQIKKMFRHPLYPFMLADVDVILASARQYCGKADKGAGAIILNGTRSSTLMHYMQLQEQKKQSEKYSKKLEADIQRLKAILAAEMGASCTAICDMGGSRYTLTYNPVRKPIVDKDNLARLKLQYPEIYEQFVTVSEFRTFHVKVSALDVA